MPLVTILTRSDPLKCEAYTFLAGGLGSLSLTLWFLPVLYLFQPFLDGLRKEGVDMNTIVRLTKFHELNTIRTLLRLFFAIPVCILAIDGIRPQHHVNESMFGSEFLSMLAAFGVVLSSGLTLVVFFPRSIENEIAAHDAGIRNRLSFHSRTNLTVSREQELYGTYDIDDACESKRTSPSSLYPMPAPLPRVSRGAVQPQLPSLQTQLPPAEGFPLTPNRRRSSLEDGTSATAMKPPLRYMDRFNNPATKVSLFRQSFRSSIVGRM